MTRETCALAQPSTQAPRRILGAAARTEFKRNKYEDGHLRVVDGELLPT